MTDLFMKVDTKVIQKQYDGIFKIFIFFDFMAEISNLRFWTKFEIWDGHKIENLKNSCKKFLCHFDIYLHEKIWLNLTCSFLHLRHFMLKMTIFSEKYDYPYIS